MDSKFVKWTVGFGLLGVVLLALPLLPLIKANSLVVYAADSFFDLPPS